MVDQPKSVLVIGFNTRPLAYSLRNAGYEVYAIDFFGDLDLYPNVKDCLILSKELNSDYSSLKDEYSKFFSRFTIQMLEKYHFLDYLIIGSGLDDAYEEREEILNTMKNGKYRIISLNNNLNTIKRARNIESIFNFLKSQKIIIPFTISYKDLENYTNELEFPIILKKRSSAGGLNVFKIQSLEEFLITIKKLKNKGFNPLEWMVQEYLEGIPISCTIISNGKECEIISINQQIIGEKCLNSPKEFMYCGNIVPASLPRKDIKLISKISMMLSIELNLRGINGLDYVLKQHHPFLMEINPRIPGSISASEMSLGLNLLDLHIKSFFPNKWNSVKNKITSAKFKGYSTKLIFFAPKEIKKSQVTKINAIEFVHDKSEPNKNILEGEPVCTILVNENEKSESYKRALEIVNNIKEIIE